MNQADQAGLEDFQRLIRRHIALMATCMLVGGIGAAAMSFALRPVFRARVLLQMDVESSSDLLSAMNPAFSRDPSKLFTQLELARSRTVLERVSKKLGPEAGESLEDAVERLENIVDASVVRNTNLIELTAEDEDPVRVRDIANALGDELVAISIERKQEESRRIREFLDTQVDKIREDLFKSEANLSQRAVKVNEEVYRLLLSKRHEANISEHSQLGDLMVVDPAAVPKKPVRPRKVINTLLGLGMGLMLGLIAVFWREHQVSGIDSVEELEELSKLPVLGSIPQMKIPPNMDWLANPSELLGERDKEGRLESYRMLAANLELLPSEQPRKTLLIASAVPGEGKSRTTACLGLAMAREGRKVVVVEGDLRRQMLGGLWSFSGLGLIGALTGKCNLRAALRMPDPSYPYFSILPAGGTVANPTELLGSEAFTKMLSTLAGEFDVILIDSSPLLLTPDALKLAGEVDGVLMIVESHQTPKKLFIRGLRQLELINVKPMGMILNKLAGRSLMYGSYYARYYRQTESSVKKVS